ncbi:MAG: aspartyl/glutamyl-tRNA amidotransferase subunit A [Deltaproteobacteria bacterium RBG_16_54_18]|nr:MAG: aspartyl/glutamyl-tRNA amidotransferase subunit A [Deltaproteobacteria bacterium RBG_16_54_18]
MYRLTIHELHERLKGKEVSAQEVTGLLLERISTVDPQIKAYLLVTAEEAMAQARAADKRITAGGIALLTGIPLAIKDNMCTQGIKTTCASRILENFIPPYDATVVKRLKDAGGIILGKTNMDEFAMGSSTENSRFTITHNPWQLDAIPGGSSGGSAAAVAADACIAALGSDTGGSIRQPAACCGAVGMKPTYGRVSRYGLVAFGSSLDQIGPLTKDVEDCAIMLNAIAGHDPFDSTTLNIPVPDYCKVLVKDIKGWVIGVPREFFGEGMDPEVEGNVTAAIKVLEGMGARVKEITLPHTGYAVATYYIICTAEASSNLARYDGVKYGFRSPAAKELMTMYRETRSEGFGPEVKRRIMLGTYVLSAGYYDAYYRKAAQVRTLIKEDFERAFQECDVIITPTAPTPAFRIGQKVQDPLQMYLSDIFTISVNLAGVPAISIPCGFSNHGLPIGLQIIGRHNDEERIIQAAYTFEQNTDHHAKRPALA